MSLLQYKKVHDPHSPQGTDTCMCQDIHLVKKCSINHKIDHVYPQQ